MSEQHPKVWLIGENNPYGPDQRYALYYEPKGSAGERLCRLVLGLEPRQYLRHFHRRNTLVGSSWSAPKAREGAANILAETAPGDSVVLFGKRVWDAWFPLLQLAERHAAWQPYHVHVGPESRTFAALPHPSGLSRAWNEPGAFLRARGVVLLAAPWLRGVLQGVDSASSHFTCPVCHREGCDGSVHGDLQT